MQTNMDLNQDETIATDDDSGEVDESFYLSRSSSDLRLTLTTPVLYFDQSWSNVAKSRDL